MRLPQTFDSVYNAGPQRLSKVDIRGEPESILRGMIIRQAVRDDLPQIVSIYNESVLHSIATFDTVPKTAKDQEPWFDHHQSPYPIFVEEKDSTIRGWGCLSPWSDRCAYAGTAENSVYVAPEARGQGLGSRLLEALICDARRTGLHTLIARISDGNEVSLSLHRRFGFQKIGIMREVGLKFGKRLDVHLYQLLLPDFRPT